MPKKSKKVGKDGRIATTIRLTQTNYQAVWDATREGRAESLQGICDVAIPMYLGMDLPVEPEIPNVIVEGLSEDQQELVQMFVDLLRDPPKGERLLMEATAMSIRGLDLHRRREKGGG
jgi:hypothetical protein